RVGRLLQAKTEVQSLCSVHQFGRGTNEQSCGDLLLIEYHAEREMEVLGEIAANEIILISDCVAILALRVQEDARILYTAKAQDEVLGLHREGSIAME